MIDGSVSVKGEERASQTHTHTHTHTQWQTHTHAMDHFNDIIMRLFKNEVGESAVDD